MSGEHKQDNNEIIYVSKRDGRRQPLDYEKANKPLLWACEDLTGVSASLIAMRSKIQFVDGITTEDIHKVYVKTAADLISESQPNYQYVAGRLAMFALRKEAYGEFTPPNIKEHYKKVTDLGLYHGELLDAYSDEDWRDMERIVDHSLDLTFAYAAVKQFEGKYLTQHRVDKKIKESPHMSYILIAATLFMKEKPSERMEFIRNFYNALASQEISLPTPIMSGARTKTKQYSSCVLIESGDDLDSINATASSIVNYVSKKAGIGIGFGSIRGLGSSIRNGEAFHTGCIPFLKYFQTAVKCCSQGGVRGGAATAFYPMWHIEYQSLIVLKNNRGVEENRVRHLDYGVQLNRLMYQRLIDDSFITLFSPADVPGLYEAFFADQNLFEELYERYEKDPEIRKERIRAVDAFSLLLQERASTGRIYIQNVDHTNEFGAFDAAQAPVRQSNLCMEITLPTKPISNVESDEGEIALCTLAAFNLGAIDDLGRLRELSKILVRALDNLLSYQDYPVISAYLGTQRRRSLGVGVINFAYYLAKNGLKYSDSSANNLTHETFEAIQYYLLSASADLAAERGACDAYGETKYSQGVLPIDNYKRSTDAIHTQELLCDWSSLRSKIAEFGLRNSTLTALMPSETSSQISNATNGIEPPRGLMTVKVSKDGVLKQVVPDVESLRDMYELVWKQGSNNGYIELVSIMQKFVDQAISANTNYDPSRYEEGKVPMTELMSDLITAYKLGVKTLYYHNTRDGAKDEQQVANSDDDCEGGGCKI